MLNDLMHILKDVKHHSRNRFINILNNDYLYNNHLLEKYLMKADDGEINRYHLFMEHLNNNTKNDDERVEVVGMIKDRNDKVKNKTFRRLRR